MTFFAAVYLALSSLSYLCLIAFHASGRREGVRAVAVGEASASRVPSGPLESRTPSMTTETRRASPARRPPQTKRHGQSLTGD